MEPNADPLAGIRQTLRNLSLETFNEMPKDFRERWIARFAVIKTEASARRW